MNTLGQLERLRSSIRGKTEKGLPLEVFEGLMAGDGGLSPSKKSARFHLDLSGAKSGIPNEKLLGYLRYLSRNLLALGVMTSPGYPKVCYSNRQPFEYCSLLTLTAPFLTLQRKRWYPNQYGSNLGCKEIPEGYILTICSLATLFEGDGSSTPNGPSVYIVISTQRFSVRSIKFLEGQLHILGLHTGRAYVQLVRGTGIKLTILQDSVNDFMHMIDPYMNEPYRYKIKYRND